jgi:hypothetical protein
MKEKGDNIGVSITKMWQTIIIRYMLLLGVKFGNMNACYCVRI